MGVRSRSSALHLHLQTYRGRLSLSISKHQTIRLLLAHSSFFVFTLLSSCLNTFHPHPSCMSLWLTCTHCHATYVTVFAFRIQVCEIVSGESPEIKAFCPWAQAPCCLFSQKACCLFNWKRSDMFKLLCNSLNSERLLVDYCLLKQNKLFICLSANHRT